MTQEHSELRGVFAIKPDLSQRLPVRRYELDLEPACRRIVTNQNSGPRIPCPIKNAQVWV